MKNILDYNDLYDANGNVIITDDLGGDYKDRNGVRSDFERKKNICPELPATAYMVTRREKDSGWKGYREFTEPSKTEQEAVDDFRNNLIAIVACIAAIVAVAFLF